jgi:hypothetical protein
MLEQEMKKSKEFKSLFESDGIKREYLDKAKRPNYHDNQR